VKDSIENIGFLIWINSSEQGTPLRNRVLNAGLFDPASGAQTVNSYKESDHKPNMQSWVVSLSALLRNKKKKMGELSLLKSIDSVL
jgi:hypothetical protein